MKKYCAKTMETAINDLMTYSKLELAATVASLLKKKYSGKIPYGDWAAKTAPSDPDCKGVERNAIEVCIQHTSEHEKELKKKFHKTVSRLQNACNDGSAEVEFEKALIDLE